MSRRSARRVAKAKSHSLSRGRRRLTFEALEDRRVLATFTVSNFNDGFVDSAGDAPGTLRQAIFDSNAAPGADTIDFSTGPGTIFLFDGEYLITDSLTIDASSVMGDLIIDASTDDPDPGTRNGSGIRIFNIDNNAAGLIDVELRGLTLQGADTHSDGGAIHNEESLIIAESVITGNTSGRGAGVHNYFGYLHIIDSQFTNNHINPNGGFGAAVTNWRGTLRITDSTISGNGDGFAIGAVSNNNGNAYITGSTLADNGSDAVYSTGLSVAGDAYFYMSDSTVSGNGSNGLSLHDCTSVIQDSTISDNLRGIRSRLQPLTITRTTISGNQGAPEGGGIYNISGDLTIVDSTIGGNSSTETGGGIQSQFSNLSITGSTISGNSTVLEGGGLWLTTPNYGIETLNITNSTISGNSVRDVGGGIWVRTFVDDILTIAHSTITDNIADSEDLLGARIGGGIYHVDFSVGTVELDHTIVAGNELGGGGRWDISGEVDTTYSLIGDDTGATINDDSTSLIGSGVDPIDPMLDVLANYGGPTLTHALLPGSPAIDAGIPNAQPNVGGIPEFDQRGVGFSRVLDGDSDGNVYIDIGAFESAGGALLVSTLEDDFDSDYSFGDFSLREAIFLANATDGFELILFDASLDGGTIFLDGVVLAITDSMTIDALSLPNGITIDAQNLSRVIAVDNFTNLVDKEVVLAGLTITGGSSSGVLNTEDLTIDRCVITGNTATWGGGFYNHPGGEAIIRNTVISGNSASSSGGGIYNWNGSILIEDSTISGNSGGDAAGIHNALVSSLIIKNTTISGNNAVNTGGGIRADEGSVSIVNSTISGNTAQAGGGIFNESGHVSIRFSTITENNSNDFAGSGIRSHATLTTITEVEASIIAGNNHTDVAADFPDTFVSHGYNVIGTGSLTNFDAEGDITGVLDPLLGPLDDNGGPTFTHEVLSGSPAVDLVPVLAGPVHEFLLDGSLSDTFGGPDLVALGGTVTATSYEFGANEGLNLSSANIDPAQYSIELLFSYDDYNGYQKFIDFADLTTDTGLHTNGDQLDFYPVHAEPAGLVTGTTYHLVMTRDAGTEQVAIYLDGTLQFSFTDFGDDAVLTGPNHIIRLFQDDTVTGGSESESGQVEMIRIYDTALSAANVEALYLGSAGLTLPSLYDQRGVGYDRAINGNADAGAFELQLVPDADFDQDGDVDGMDFLAWQRGYGTAAPNADKQDGDADDDADVDSADLGFWEEQYGYQDPEESLAGFSSASALGTSEECVDHMPTSVAPASLRASVADQILASYVADDSVGSPSSYWLALDSLKTSGAAENGLKPIECDELAEPEQIVDRAFAELSRGGNLGTDARESDSSALQHDESAEPDAELGELGPQCAADIKVLAN